jgi:hypothetical protein
LSWIHCKQGKRILEEFKKKLGSDSIPVNNRKEAKIVTSGSPENGSIAFLSKKSNLSTGIQICWLVVFMFCCSAIRTLKLEFHSESTPKASTVFVECLLRDRSKDFYS